MKKLRVAACMLMLALAGCDNNDNAPTAVKKDAPSEVTKAASSENASSAKLSVPERQKLAQQSAGKVLHCWISLKSNLMVQPRWC